MNDHWLSSGQCDEMNGRGMMILTGNGRFFLEGLQIVNHMLRFGVYEMGTSCGHYEAVCITENVRLLSDYERRHRIGSGRENSLTE